MLYIYTFGWLSNNQPQHIPYLYNYHKSAFFKGNSPKIANMAEVQIYNDKISVGSVVSTVLVSDDDPEDANNLTLTLESSSNGGAAYFDIRHVAGSCNYSD